MSEFIIFLIKSSFGMTVNGFDDPVVELSLQKTIKDIKYHYPQRDRDEIIVAIKSNKTELIIFLYRLGRELFKLNAATKQLDLIHGLMRKLGGCEIYFSTEIDEGFYIVHGVGSVIGSRTKIGKGLIIYHNCTIGHFKDFEGGAVIGDNVSMFPGSMILGELKIGDEVVIGANSTLIHDAPNRSVCVGNPAKIINSNGHLENSKIRYNYIPLNK